MIKKLKKKLSKKLQQFFPFLVSTLGQGLIWMLLCTCRWQIRGLTDFIEKAKKEKCILMLWHNRLALVPMILFRNAPQFIYSAFVSKSRDGDLISSVVHSYKAGRTIRVSHNARHEALRELIRHLEEKREVVIITPDGPRGPCYKVKPGIALAAIETEAYIIPLNWTASRFWELGTWDGLRIPKPFSKIDVTFGNAILMQKQAGFTVEKGQEFLQNIMNQIISQTS